MFIDSIEQVSKYTRPIHSIIRTYSGKKITSSSSTLFFVNEQGYALTCKHVVGMLTSSDQLNQTFANFKKDREKLSKDGNYKRNLKGLEIKYKFNDDTIIQIKNTFVDCVDSMSGFTTFVHPKYDLAIIKFNDFKNLHYSEFARFIKDPKKLKQGKSLCRLGFPFPEFNNFTYNESADDIEWTNQGINRSPIFPMDGMITRFIAEDNQISGIELSTPGLKGQSGGPLFDENGHVYGMQFSTKHLHLGFDMVDAEIVVNNKPKKVSDYSFIHLGQCIHVDIIKEFLKQNNVKYCEAD